MKSVLLAEYAAHRDPALAPEGEAMQDCLSASFARCGYDLVYPGPGDFGSELERLAPECDYGLVIAPDHLLARYTKILEDNTVSLGCGSMNAALCANKRLTGRVLAAGGVPVPKETRAGTRVIKPVTGCGTKGVRLAESAPGRDEFAQEYIRGDNLSVSLIAGRIVGQACLYYTDALPLVLALNRQEIAIGPDGGFRYLGGETPVDHPLRDECISTAQKAVSLLGCQGYADMDIVAGDRAYVVDVNPRITLSVVGLATCMKEEIADLIVAAAEGRLPAEVHLDGRVRFDQDGKVTRL
jgi:tyramine---L-glutamate ligase